MVTGSTNKWAQRYLLRICRAASFLQMIFLDTKAGPAPRVGWAEENLAGPSEIIGSAVAGISRTLRLMPL